MSGSCGCTGRSPPHKITRVIRRAIAGSSSIQARVRNDEQIGGLGRCERIEEGGQDGQRGEMAACSGQVFFERPLGKVQSTRARLFRVSLFGNQGGLQRIETLTTVMREREREVGM